MTNRLITLTDAHLIFLNALRALLVDANALPAMAPQFSAYGDLATALRTAIAHALEADTALNFAACTEWAWAIHSSAIDNGEDITYQIALIREGRLDQDFRV